MTLDNEQIVRKAYQIAEDKDLMPVSACGPLRGAAARGPA